MEGVTTRRVVVLVLVTAALGGFLATFGYMYSDKLHHLEETRMEDLDYWESNCEDPDVMKKRRTADECKHREHNLHLDLRREAFVAVVSETFLNIWIHVFGGSAFQAFVVTMLLMVLLVGFSILRTVDTWSKARMTELIPTAHKKAV